MRKKIIRCLFIFILAVLVLDCDYVKGLFEKNRSREMSETYLKFHNAIQIGDILTVKSLLSKNALSEMEASGITFEKAIAMISSLTPPAVEIKGISQDNPLAIDVIGKGEGWEKSKGKIDFVDEGGLKIAKVNWSTESDELPAFLDNSIYNPNYKIKLGGVFNNAPSLAGIDKKYLAKDPFVSAIYAGPFIKDKNYKPQIVHTIKTEGDFSKVEYSPSGNYLFAVGYGDFSVKVFDGASWALVNEFKLDNRPTGLAASPKGDVLVVGDVYSNLIFFPISGSFIEEPIKVEADAGKHLKIAISPNGKLLATVSFDKILSVWSVEERRALIKASVSWNLSSVAFSPAGPILAAGTNGNEFVLWDLRTGKGKSYTIPKVDGKSDVSSIGFSPDGKYLVTAHMDSSVTVWSVADQKQIHNFFVANSSAFAAGFSPDGKNFASVHAHNKFAYVWDAQSAAQLAVLKGHEGNVTDLAFSPDGRYLATCGEDKTIIIWE